MTKAKSPTLIASISGLVFLTLSNASWAGDRAVLGERIRPAQWKPAKSAQWKPRLPQPKEQARLSPKSRTLPPEATTKTDSVFKEFVDRDEVSGAVSLIARNGEIVHHQAVGLADIASSRPMRKDTVFWIASITKPITSAALMILVDEKKLALDDPVKRYIPAFAGLKMKDGSRPRTAPTIAHLLSHTSGINSPENILALDMERAVEAMASRPLKFQPGAKWDYEFGHYAVARIIETVSKTRFETFVEKRILSPLSMKETTFFPDKKLRKRMATLYRPGPGGKGLKADTTYLSLYDEQLLKQGNPSHGLASTAADLNRFFQMMLAGGIGGKSRVLSKQAVRDMITPQTGNLNTGYSVAGYSWGLGCCIVRKPQAITALLSPGTFGHGSALGAEAWADPRNNTVAILLIERTGFGNPDVSSIRKRFFELIADVNNKTAAGRHLKTRLAPVAREL